MRVRSTLPFLAAMAFFVVPLLAQESLPPSYLEFLATLDRLQTLTQSDFRELTSKAQAGAPDALYLLALVYEEDLLVPRDKATAQRWMLKSAEQGYVPAQLWMGKMYFENDKDWPVPHYADADRWFRLAATQGDAEAQFWLGTAYERGLFGGIDYQESLKWLRKSAAQGLPDAQFCLGRMYEYGEGVPESDEMAAYWYRRAADHFPRIGGMRVGGVWEAEGQLVYLYRDGRLKRNDIEAYMWFTVVDSSVDPPIDPATDDIVKQVAKRMTRAEITEAQQMAKDWIIRHPWRPKVPASLNR
jgi:Sel1 repeat